MYRDFEDSRSPHYGTKERTSPRSERQPETRQPEINDGRSIFELRDKTYRLNHLEARILSDVGRFRTVEKADLLQNVYQGSQETFDRDLRHLHRQNLVRIVGPKGSLTKYIVLSKPAKQLTEKYFCPNARQEIYAGAVKIRELKHDAALYRLYQKRAQEIEKRGGRVTRVVLDYEFKRDINQCRAKTKNLPKSQQQEQLKQIAEAENLKVINGKIPLPDLRIEYEDSHGELSHTDLEYVTEDYRADAIAEKRAAGFQLYGDDPRGRKPYGPDLIGGLISL